MTDIAFIGGGNMARALIGGLLAADRPAGTIHVADPSAAQLALATQLGAVQTGRDNHAAAATADVIVLAVKPQYTRVAAESIRTALVGHRPVVLSVAAGVRVAQLRDWLGGHDNVVRAMPNTPALVGQGATGLYAPNEVDQHDRDKADAVMAAVGCTVWLEREDDIDIVTALSGSGPAYFFLLLEALEAAAIEMGLDAAAAARLARATAAGSATMATQSTVALSELRRRVTSPGGTTEAALRTLADNHFETAVNKALKAARQRSIELSNPKPDE